MCLQLNTVDLQLMLYILFARFQGVEIVRAFRYVLCVKPASHLNRVLVYVVLVTSSFVFLLLSWILTLFVLSLQFNLLKHIWRRISCGPKQYSTSDYWYHSQQFYHTSYLCTVHHRCISYRGFLTLCNPSPMFFNFTRCHYNARTPRQHNGTGKYKMCFTLLLLNCSYPCPDVTILPKNPTNTPIYVNTTSFILLRPYLFRTSRGRPRWVLIPFASRVNKIRVQM
jgi:hypothetical protein